MEMINRVDGRIVLSTASVPNVQTQGAEVVPKNRWNKEVKKS